MLIALSYLMVYQQAFATIRLLASYWLTPITTIIKYAQRVNWEKNHTEKYSQSLNNRQLQ
ncbi:hypothetical protein AB4298_13700 [Shewanella sp. 10N.261.52.F9]|uniref:hypothetical protein n=1 Tax=Shewanella sp. 10N.261.52.F9 TaxID=3229684 RepID=UPI00355113C0